jgi:GNAT superfamily N-acetyltransferase
MMQTIPEQPHNLSLTLTDSPTDADNSFIHQQIREFNNQISPAHRAVRAPGTIVPLSIFVRDDKQQLVGGLVANTYWNWLEIDCFWVADILRGQGLGERMLRMAEIEAIMRGCIRVHLKTFGFQARTFYEKYGYRSVGQLNDFPPGETFYWMRKELGRPERVSFRTVENEDDVLAFLVQMNRNRPERQEVIDHLMSQLDRLSVDAPVVVELCSGPGMVARRLVDRFPRARYTGIDYSAVFVGLVRRQLAPVGDRATLLQADLNKEDWLEMVPQPPHAIISMQSLHDLGDEYHVNRIYGLAYQLLNPGGLFINADLTPAEDASVTEESGRLPVERHLQLLGASGFTQVECTLNLNGLACMVGIKPG